MQGILESLSTLQLMWDKAEELINGENTITAAPGNDGASKMVISYSSPVPHLVTRSTGGQYKCDTKCLNWSSSGLCSHTLAVAELNNGLSEWYNTSSLQPNITTVAMSGLPSGRGRKGGTAKRTKGKHPNCAFQDLFFNPHLCNKVLRLVVLHSPLQVYFSSWAFGYCDNL